MSGSKHDADKRQAEHRAKQKLKRKDAVRKSGGTPPVTTVPSAWVKFEYNYGPDMLQGFGPHVIAEWAVPDRYAAFLALNNRPVPPPIVGHILVDTGASSTCIAEEVAKELGLTQIDTVTTYGAHGGQTSRVYLAKFRLSVRDEDGQIHTVEQELATMAIHDMQGLHDAMGVRQSDGSPVRPVGLLGRDFLRHTRLTYHGTEGRFQIAVSKALVRQP